jgi:ATP-dependent RNA helicase SUPV3L1/SUV3
VSDIKDSQLTFLPDGRVGFQPDPTNPLPGAACARLEKGERPLHPRLVVLPDLALPEGFEARAVQWLESRIAAILEPLALLEKAVGLSPALETLAQGLLCGFGAVTRAEFRACLQTLTPEDRQILRARKIRPGSLHVYFQDLNKPMAVRLRALLWALWHDAPLPPPLPHDGAVSALCPDAAGEVFGPSYWLSVGYPLCARRLVRIDMLDRLVGAVYDAADKGLFRATHQMAEWLGVPIDTLYAVLESLGHTRVEEAASSPAPCVAAETEKTETEKTESGPDVSPAPAAEAPASETESEKVPAEVVAPEVESSASLAVPEAKPEESQKPGLRKAEVKKPELALFRLARPQGALPQRAGGGRKTFSARPLASAASPEGAAEEAQAPSEKRRFRKGKGGERSEESHDSRPSPKSGARAGRPQDRDKGPQGKPSFDRSSRPRSGRDSPADRAERPERVIRAEAKVNPDDSPFAVLRQLVQSKTSVSDSPAKAAGEG